MLNDLTRDVRRLIYRIEELQEEIKEIQERVAALETFREEVSFKDLMDFNKRLYGLD